MVLLPEDMPLLSYLPTTEIKINTGKFLWTYVPGTIPYIP